jgi:hypothetical protein
MRVETRIQGVEASIERAHLGTKRFFGVVDPVFEAAAHLVDATVDVVQPDAVGPDLGREEVLYCCSDGFQDILTHIRLLTGYYHSPAQPMS